jgi:hypothetical protein
MSEKWTKGPWDMGDENDACCQVNIGETRCTLDRQCPYTGKYVISRNEMLANAHLIAAAPGTYDALDALVAVVGLTAFKHESQRAVLQEAIDSAVAVLKKARGES